MKSLEEILALPTNSAQQVAQDLFKLSALAMLKLRGKVHPYALQVFCDDAQSLINALRTPGGKEKAEESGAVPAQRDPL